MYIVRQKVPNAKTLDFENFCILLQKIALMRFPHVEKFIEEWAQTPGGKAVVLAAAKAKRAAALAMTAEEMNAGLKNPFSALGDELITSIMTTTIITIISNIITTSTTNITTIPCIRCPP